MRKKGKEGGREGGREGGKYLEAESPVVLPYPEFGGKELAVPSTPGLEEDLRGVRKGGREGKEGGR